MRAVAVLLVLTASAIAHAEPRPVIAGAAVGYGALDPGDNGYLPSALTGPHGSAYVGRSLRDGVAVVAGGWLFAGDGDHAPLAYGGEAGVRYAYATGASVTARVGLGHVEWSDSDGGYLDDGGATVGLAAGFEVLRESWGAIEVSGALTRVMIDTASGHQMVYAASVGYAY